MKFHVVFHGRLHEEEYYGIEDSFVFGKVGNGPIQIKSEKITSRVVECKSLSGYNEMGSNWAESEFLFAVYKTMLNDKQNVDPSEWIGFIQYDNSTTTEDGVNVVDKLKSLLPTLGERHVVSFVPIDMDYEIHANHIAMDFSNPQKLQGDPLCYFPMMADYNKFYGSKFSYGDLLSHNKIALCSSFMMKNSSFMEMMRFCSWVTERHDLNLFDPERKHRLAGGYMERYYGLWIAMQGMSLVEMKLGGLNRL